MVLHSVFSFYKTFKSSVWPPCGMSSLTILHQYWFSFGVSGWEMWTGDGMANSGKVLSLGPEFPGHCQGVWPHCRSQGRVSQWWVSQVETSLSPDRNTDTSAVYVDNLVTTDPSVKSPSNGGIQLEPVITNGNGNSSAAGQGGLVEVDMDRVSTTPAVPSPAPLSSMSATPDSHVEAGTDIGNVHP